MIDTRIAKPLPLIIVIVLFLLWITPGLVGRDLWKADEPYSFGLTNHIIKTGDWVIPTLAGEPFMEKPPLFYLTAAGFAHVLSPWMKLHDAARMATAFYMFLTVLFIGLAARESIGNNSLGIAMVVLIGSTGLQETAHKLITDVAMIAGISMALYGLAISPRRSILGGILLGTGAGIGFLSKGLLAPGLIGIMALVLPVLSVDWRKKQYLHTLLIAFVAALPWFILWPLAVYLRSPQFFIEWFWYENLGRFLGYGNVGRKFSPFDYVINLPWFALPSLPLAIWAIWHYRRTWRTHAGILVPLVAFLVILIVLSLSSSIRNIYALPLLLPLALLATAGADSFPDRAQRAINGFSLVVFGCLAGVLWIGWLAMITGFPSSLAHLLYRLQPDYTPTFNGFHLAIASLYTLLWVFFVLRATSFLHYYLINWTAGIVLTWGLLMTLWLPWFDAGSGYGPLLTELKRKIPADYRYVMTQEIGESERALLEYYTGVLPRSIERYGIGDCDLLLIVSGRIPGAPPAGLKWKVVWEQWRPRDPRGLPKERFVLYQRMDGKKGCW